MILDIDLGFGSVVTYDNIAKIRTYNSEKITKKDGCILFTWYDYETGKTSEFIPDAIWKVDVRAPEEFNRDDLCWLGINVRLRDKNNTEMNIVTNSTNVYLMNDEGKTLKRL